MGHPRISYRQAIDKAGIATWLQAFDWCAAGTPPLGLDIDGSDIDILCCAPDSDLFCDTVWRAFSGCEAFRLHQWADEPRSIVANFSRDGWPFEIFADLRPLRDQAGWRHFDVERRLLALGGDALRDRVLDARRLGLKTEPAFAAILDLPGDAYAAMLALFERDDAELAALLQGIPGLASR